MYYIITSYEVTYDYKLTIISKYLLRGSIRARARTESGNSEISRLVNGQSVSY